MASRGKTMKLWKNNQLAANGRPIQENFNHWFQESAAVNESAMMHLLASKAQCPYIGEENGKFIRDGISRFTSPSGSIRLLWSEKGIPLAALQVMSKDGKSGIAANAYTHPTARRRGLASKLFEAAFDSFVDLQFSHGLSFDGAALLNSLSYCDKKTSGQSYASKNNEDDDFDWSKRVGNPVLALPFEEGLPSKEKAKALSAWVRANSDLYKNRYVKLYHATAPDLDIEGEGLKPTSTTRRRSYQSTSGFVYLANTPDRAKTFGDMGNKGHSTVYEVIVPIRKLLADKDQLFNQRVALAETGESIGNSIGESIVYGGGVRIKGYIEPWAIRKIILNRDPCKKINSIKP